MTFYTNIHVPLRMSYNLELSWSPDFSLSAIRMYVDSCFTLKLWSKINYIYHALAWTDQAKKGLCLCFSACHLLIGFILSHILSTPTSDDPNPRKCLLTLCQTTICKAKFVDWLFEAWTMRQHSTCFGCLLPWVRCYSYNIFDFTILMKLWWHQFYKPYPILRDTGMHWLLNPASLRAAWMKKHSSYFNPVCSC